MLAVDAGWSSLAARRAHNPKVVGSNPAPATSLNGGMFSLRSSCKVVKSCDLHGGQKYLEKLRLRGFFIGGNKASARFFNIVNNNWKGIYAA